MKPSNDPSTSRNVDPIDGRRIGQPPMITKAAGKV
jgi:hypothetical protein